MLKLYELLPARCIRKLICSASYSHKAVSRPIYMYADRMDSLPGLQSPPAQDLRAHQLLGFSPLRRFPRLDAKQFSPFLRYRILRCQYTCKGHEDNVHSFNCDSDNEQVNCAVGLKELASEKEEAKAVLIQFLKTKGLSTALSTRLTKKASRFIGHLLSMLHTCYRMRYLTGRELTTVEIQNTILPYLDALAAEHGDGLVDILVYFPHPPPLKKECSQKSLVSSRKRSATKDIHSSGLTVNGNFRPSVSYALALGLSLQQVQDVTRRFPGLLYLRPEKKIEPLVNYFLALGVTKPGILKIFLKRPQIFGCSLEENLIPTMHYLESIGVDKRHWGRILVHFPALLTYGKVKLQEAVCFLKEAGLSSVDVGRTITRFPHVVSYSVENNLNPTVDFLQSVGVTDISAFLRRSPQVLGYSIEGNIKPTIRFLIELGYSKDDVIIIINRFPQILGLTINGNVKPKWDYFAQTGWSTSQIVIFPQYFGYNLEARIKPRFEEVLKIGCCWNLNRILSSSEKEFQRLLKRERDKVENPLLSSSVCHAPLDNSINLCDYG